VKLKKKFESLRPRKASPHRLIEVCPANSSKVLVKIPSHSPIKPQRGHVWGYLGAVNKLASFSHEARPVPMLNMAENRIIPQNCTQGKIL
jgi:hypothetical protein